MKILCVGLVEAILNDRDGYVRAACISSRNGKEGERWRSKVQFPLSSGGVLL